MTDTTTGTTPSNSPNRMLDHQRIQQHADLVYRTCLRITGNAQDAADVTQEVFIAWMQQHRSIRGPVAGWLYGTARQRSLDWLRTRHRRALHEQRAAPNQISEPPDDVPAELDHALSELPTESRTLVIEHHVMGLTQLDLATRYRCTQATISRRLTQAIELLRTTLQRRGVVLSTAIIVSQLTTHNAVACPAAIMVPVIAQAHVLGAGALLGTTIIAHSGIFWVKCAAAGILFLVISATVGYFWRVAWLEKELDKDWTAIATKELPPIAAKQLAAVPMPNNGWRYPSIEQLIAQQKADDIPEQAAFNKLYAPGSSIDKLYSYKKYTYIGSVISKKSNGGQLSEIDIKNIADFREIINPLLRFAEQCPVALGARQRVEQAYQGGEFAREHLRSTWIEKVIVDAHLLTNIPVKILINEALSTGNPREKLTQLDAWLAARDRGSMTWQEVLTSMRSHYERDGCYLRLIKDGKLSADDIKTWLIEPPRLTKAWADLIVGYNLLLTIPLIEDLRFGRVAENKLRIFQLDIARNHTRFEDMLTILTRGLRGEAKAGFAVNHLIGKSEENQPPAISEITIGEMLTQKETKQRMYRLAAQLLLDDRAGKPLPETMATNDGRGANQWGIKYQRLSEKRFVLIMDPLTGVPVFSGPQTKERIRREAQSLRPSKSNRWLVNGDIFVEVDVSTPTAETPVDHEPLSEEAEPTIQLPTY
jgi:RNA polymerase sigma factor (sigma-70 family)